ncbi:ImmA/IrrE family metallo-endopeptidase [Paenibacillus sp. GSMTC-2017]|uniref:ImmA/IrrE family metallo-endopeptidase n=1 Tax=Paenibacillus sp. GSMTC-2017 TaxID=2794350 RepID=UPI0018D8BCA9|nr:ImmA/IrrE family metallo-endopeptidase [Paenibacillus sp. GSMTC-2017]MBH5316717.1 ImmA/IrrE family metallo-endopeptidase [Paenibacillus sp. GSMTC-2017]
MLDFSLYKPSDLEIWISTRYIEHGILTPSDLTIKAVSQAFNVEVRYYSGPCFAQWEENSYSFIFLKEDLGYEELRKEFFHELCHPLRHVGIQDSMPSTFQDLQEAQATQFQMVAAMPYFMLEKYEPTKYLHHYLTIISEAFRLPYTFVKQRIEQILRKIHSEREERTLRARTTMKPVIYTYSHATNNLLNQLNRQIAESRSVYRVED